ncbi:hypothetical protein [Oceaniradius stylonematis]|uniref:hypothetical protein n=1 Tax=Oceaniradius stylonematis TaxID=2184161 RepID=UPI003B5B5CD3
MRHTQTRARAAVAIAAGLFVAGFLLRIDTARLDLLGVSAVIFMAALLIVDAIVEAGTPKADRPSGPLAGSAPGEAGSAREESNNG